MVIVRAAFPQGWRGSKYGQDEKMPATKIQAERLTKSGQAYYDIEDDRDELQGFSREREPGNVWNEPVYSTDAG